MQNVPRVNSEPPELGQSCGLGWRDICGARGDVCELWGYSRAFSDSLCLWAKGEEAAGVTSCNSHQNYLAVNRLLRLPSAS